LSLAAFDEALARERGAAFIVGIDEAGRGPLAGPVFACACVLRPETGPALCEVNDSKKLSPKKVLASDDGTSRKRCFLA